MGYIDDGQMKYCVQNKDMEIMVDFEKRETVTLGELLPKRWGDVKISE